jgi:hypothetical protein
MSDGLKPLIFLEPLSETLKKLKEVFEANAESEGVELYEVDELEEAAQLIPNLGQALILTASPKKCAMMLQQNRKSIKSLQTKTILLSPKAIPRKTLDKFMKVGLTECVIEPVNPKTLLYKVRLQLRSIKTAKEEEEMNQKFGDDSSKSVDGPAKKIRSDRKGDEEQEEEVKKKQNGEEVVLEDYSKPKRKSNYQEEEIDAYYKGKKKKNEDGYEEEEEDKKKSKYKEEAIEGHLKGKVTESMDIEIDEEDEEDLPSPEQMEEDLESIKHKINLEVESDIAAKTKKEVEAFEEEETKKKAAALDVEEDDSAKNLEKSDSEDLGGHYKGKVGEKLSVEEEAEYKEKAEQEEQEASSEQKKKLKLDVEEEAPDYVKKPEVDDETISLKKKKKLALVDDEQEEELIQKAIVEEDSEEEPSVEREEVEGQELESPKKDKLAVLDDEDKDRKEKNKADDIDGYLRGGEAKKKVSVEEDNEDLYQRDEDQDAADKERKRQAALMLEEDNEEEDTLKQDAEMGFEELGKKQEKLALVDDEDENNYKKNSEDLEESEKDLLQKNKLDIQDDELKRKKLAQKEEESKSGNRSDARADHIKTHYSSKESTKHNDDNWDAKWDKKKKEEDDFPNEKREEQTTTLEKEDLGEQTIDYAQLKKEFEAGSYDGVRNKKKVYGEFHEVAEVKTYTKTVMGVEGSAEQMEFEEISKEQKEGLEGPMVFEPHSLGIEIAIEVQGYYLEDDVDSYKICEFIQERISSEYLGDLVVYQNAKGDELKSFFNGRISKQLGRAPVKLTEADFEGLSRSERKELETDYEQDLQAFNLKKREVEGGFNQSWGTKLEQWKEFKTPAFRDHTFQELQNEFVFPFYEGVSLLGIAVFIPTTKFNAERAESLEVVFEVLRGLLLTEYHEQRGAGKISPSSSEAEAKSKDKTEKKSGFFGKLFGKKAG